MEITREKRCLREFTAILVDLNADQRVAWRGRREEGPSAMEKRAGVPDVLRCVLRWLRQYLEIPVYGLRERRWCLPHPVHSSALHNRQALLLHGNGPRTVHQQILPPSMVRVTRVSRYDMEHRTRALLKISSRYFERVVHESKLISRAFETDQSQA